MPPNPMFDPLVESGYLGYALRATAHRRDNNTYIASLEIRDYRYATGELLCEYKFEEEVFSDADAAMDRAMGKGQQIIDELLALMNLEEAVET